MWLAGIPRNGIMLGRGSDPGGNAGLAEAGSLQLEWLTLSARTKNPIYRKKALRVFESIHKANPDQVTVQHQCLMIKTEFNSTGWFAPATIACIASASGNWILADDGRVSNVHKCRSSRSIDDCGW